HRQKHGDRARLFEHLLERCQFRVRALVVRLHAFDGTQRVATLGAVVPLPGDQPPMPAQNGVRRKQRADLVQRLAAQDLALDGQPAGLVSVEQAAFLTELFLEDLSLGAQVFDTLLPLAIDPTAENGSQQLPGLENETHAAPAWPLDRNEPLNLIASAI